MFGGLAAGAVSKPVTGYSGVYVVSVSSVDNAGEEEAVTEASERVRIEAEAESTIPQRLLQALNDGSDIKDYRARFF